MRQVESSDYDLSSGAKLAIDKGFSGLPKKLKMKLQKDPTYSKNLPELNLLSPRTLWLLFTKCILFLKIQWNSVTNNVKFFNVLVNFMNAR